MAVENIPASIRITCDRCFKVIKISEARYQYQIKSAQYKEANDLYDQDKIYQWDFCKECNQRMYYLISNELIPF